MAGTKTRTSNVERETSNPHFRSSPLVHLYAVILAGGSGTRFWPLSRQLYPKQLLRLIGEGTLIQETMKRVVACVPADRVYVATTAHQAEAIRFQLDAWKEPLRDHLLVEPAARNTAPAIALAASVLVRQDPDAIMLVLPADHLVKGTGAFKHAVKLGAHLAAREYLVTLGIKPTRPETGYGYIQPDMAAEVGSLRGLPGYAVRRFIEKPEAKVARRFLKAGTYYWNSGMFLWRAATILDELARFQPRLARTIRRMDAGDGLAALPPEAKEAYRRLPALSIDHAALERSSRAAMIPARFGWSDVGTWSSLGEVAPRNGSGNVITGRVVDHGSRNSIVFADRRLVATIGLTDMIVVDTPDATLVCPKDRDQDVKQVVVALERQQAPERLEPQTVIRPWGTYTVLEEGTGYKLKRVTVRPGGRLSLQYHHKRSEHWVVVAGTARVTRGEETFDLGAGHSTDIPQGIPHRLENLTSEIVHIIEVQRGAYLGEDDIVRVQDDYGRIR